MAIMQNIPEVTPNDAPIPHVALSEREHSYIDEQITAALQKYMDSVQNEERKQFRELPDLTEKINHICWIWGQDPGTHEDSISLKALLVIRTLEDAVVRTDQVDKEFKMPIMEPYWQQVDRRVYDHFSTYVTDETSQNLTPYDGLTKDTPSAICVVDDYIIARLHDKTEMVRYAAIPLQKIGELSLS